MIKSINKYIKGLIALFLLSFDLILSQGSIASNRAFDMTFLDDGECAVFSVKMEERPKFSLKPINKKQLRLTIYDTLINNETDKMVSEGASVSIESGESSDLNYLIGLTRLFYKIDISWNEDKKLFHINISFADGNDGHGSSGKEIPLLRDIRFGFKNKATRMVIGLDKEPLWEIDYNDPVDVLMKLSADSNESKKERMDLLNG